MYYGLRDYGLPPSVWGGDEGCEHEWGDDQKPPTKLGAGGNTQGVYADHVDSSKAGGYNTGKPRGSAFCTLCGAWRGCLGLEPTPDLYVAHLVEVFREVWRVLRDDGTLFLNLGDSYAGSGAGGGGNRKGNEHGQHDDMAVMGRPGTPSGLKPKDLIGIPWRVAFALQADGAADWKAVQTLERVMAEMLDEYQEEPVPDKVLAVLNRLNGEWQEAKGASWYLRSDIIWAKGISCCETYSGSCMPESVTDRPTSAYEHVFLLTKSARYFYDHNAVREANSSATSKWGKSVPSKTAQAQGDGKHGDNSFLSKEIGHEETIDRYYTNGRNLRNVWAINSRFVQLRPDLDNETKAQVVQELINRGLL